MSLEDLRTRAEGGESKRSGMKIRNCSPMNLTFEELEEVVSSSPEHPKAKALKKVLDHYRSKLEPETVVAVDRKVILAVIDNKQISEIEVFDEKANRVVVENVILETNEKEAE